MKEHSDTTFNALVEAMRRNEAGTFIELVNNCDDLFGHDADGHSLMWHARQSQNPVFAETLDLLAAGKPFTEEAVQKQVSPPAPKPAPVPAAPEPAPVLSTSELEPLLHQLHESLLHGDILDDEEKKKLSNLPLAELCSYVTKNNLLHRAAEKGSLPICEQILKVGVPVDTPSTYNKSTALQNSARDGALDVCKFLLQHGASVAVKDEHGKTALHAAVCCRFSEEEKALEICKLLLKYGADLEAKDSVGATPLHKAAFEGTPAMCELLLAHGADMNAIDHSGASVLHWAASGGLAGKNADNVVFFLKRGMDVNARDYHGDTPLHAATGRSSNWGCIYPNRKGFQALLAHGADRFARNNEGKIALITFVGSPWIIIVGEFIGALLGIVLSVCFEMEISGSRFFAGELMCIAGVLIGMFISAAVAFLKGW